MALAKDIDVRLQQRRAALADFSRARSLAASKAAADDSAATQFIEKWADLSAWQTPATPGLVVSGGRAFSNNQSAASFVIKSFAFDARERFRITIEARITHGGAGSQQMVVGMDEGTPGAVPANFSAVRGLQIPGSASVQPAKYDKGTVTNLTGSSASLVVNQTYTHVITITGDDSTYSVVDQVVGTAIEWRATWARSTVTPNNLMLVCADTRTTTGMSFGRIGVRRNIATTSPVTLAENTGPSTQYATVGNYQYRVTTPTGYDSRVARPVVLLFHGNGSTATHWADNANGAAVANAFLAGGFIVAGANYTPNGSTWGAQSGLDAYTALYQFVVSRYATGPVVFYANSMGGIESLLTLAQARIPGVVAWIGTVPTASLAANYANATFTAVIQTAYGIASDGSDYTAKTAGYDPNLLDPKAFGAVPMWAYVSTDDTTVLPAQNWDIFGPKLAAYSPDYVRVNGTGGHSADFTPYTAAMVAFAQKYAGV